MKLDKWIDKIFNEFIENEVPLEIRDELIREAVYFNIKEDECSKHDLIKINANMKLLDDSKYSEIIKVSVLNYILFRQLSRGMMDEEEALELKGTFMNISSIITKYMANKITEGLLDKELSSELEILGAINK